MHLISFVQFVILINIHPKPGDAGGAMAWHPHILDKLTLSQPGGADYSDHIPTDTPGFLVLPTALHLVQ